jgi:hypothetical protein
MLIFALVAPTGAMAQAGALVAKTTGVDIGQSIEGLLVDYSSASLSAGALAKVDGDAVTPVENVRDFSVALKGDTPLSKKVFGFTITPARSAWAFPRINLSDYAAPGARGMGWRLLGSLSFAYAQGNSKHSDVDFQRRAISIETSAFFRPEDDPVVAVASEECVKQALDTLDSGNESPPQPTQPGPPPVTPAAPEAVKKAADAYKACAKKVLDEQNKHWNRSRWWTGVATGWIRRADGSGDQQGLGRMFTVGALYGFDGVDALKDRAGLSLMVRRSWREPVLDTLANGPVQFDGNTLVAGRLSGGSSTFRALIELSNAKSNGITTSQATFRRAIGIDYRITDGLWLNLRSGKQRKLDGSGEEMGTFFNLSYSPSATLTH